MANQKISARTLADSISGSEKIPIGVAGDKAITPDMIKGFVAGVEAFTELSDVPNSYTGEANKVVSVKADESGLEFVTPSGGGGGYSVTSTQPTDTSVNWADSGNPYAGSYPIRRYINGAWQDIFPEMDYYDPIGNVISKGRPLCVLVWGQSNTTTNFYSDYINPTVGDISVNNYITLWDFDGDDWSIPDFNNQPSGGNSQQWSWNLNNYGANNVQTFAQHFIKDYSRSVRVVQWRQGGTGLEYWIPGGPGYTALINAAENSGVPYFDLIIGCHGESGLADPSNPTSYTTYIDALYDGFITNIRQQDFIDINTGFIMPSTANSLMFNPVGISDQAEYAIRTLENNGDKNTAWAQGARAKNIQTPNVVPATTSSTSINLATATFPLSITVPTGLGALGGTVIVISRSDSNNFVQGEITSYNSGSGAMVINAATFPMGYDNFNGTGTHTDWDVLPQDYQHETVRDQLTFGEGMYAAYKRLGILKRPIASSTQTFSPDFKLTKNVIQYPTSDNTQINFNHVTSDGYIKIENFISSVGGRLAANKIFVNGDGDWIYAASSDGISEATIADKVITFSDTGVLISKALFAFYSAASVLQTKLEIDPDGSLGWRYQAGSGVDENASHRFDFGSKSALYMKENAGLPKFTFGKGFQSSYNSTEKTNVGIENRVGIFSSSMTASSSLTSTIFSNSPITEIPPFSVVKVDLTVLGIVNDGTKAFSVTKSALFAIEGYGVWTKLSEDASPIIGGTANAVSTLTFSVVSGQISATLTRGSDTGDYKVSSVTGVTMLTR